jgi:hypothetical protein
MKKAIAFALNTGCKFAKISRFFDEIAIVAKRQPLKSAGFVFGLGIGVGALAGWLGARK